MPISALYLLHIVTFDLLLHPRSIVAQIYALQNACGYPIIVAIQVVLYETIGTKLDPGKASSNFGVSIFEMASLSDSAGCS